MKYICKGAKFIQFIVWEWLPYMTSQKTNKLSTPCQKIARYKAFFFFLTVCLLVDSKDNPEHSDMTLLIHLTNSFLFWTVWCPKYRYIQLPSLHKMWQNVLQLNTNVQIVFDLFAPLTIFTVCINFFLRFESLQLVLLVAQWRPAKSTSLANFKGDYMSLFIDFCSTKQYITSLFASRISQQYLI